MMKKVFILFTALAMVSCGGSDKKGGKAVNAAPSKVKLLQPQNKKLCLDNRIKFEWEDATDANKDEIKYELLVSKNRDFTRITYSGAVFASEKVRSLSKATSYYWKVTAIDSKGKRGETSDVFSFYTKGEATSNAVPFSATLVSPEDNGSVAGTSINLKWKGSDADSGDTLKYDVYFGEDQEPALKESNLAAASLNVTVASGKTYYWKVNTIDASKAKSVGQVWKFTVN